MTIAYWCVLVAALLPLALVTYAKIGVPSDNRTPREDYENLPPAKRRAYAAHQNGYENFPFFAAAIIIASVSNASGLLLNILAVAYVVVRVVHGLLYINDQPSFRSLSYTVGLFINIAIFLLPAFRA